MSKASVKKVRYNARDEDVIRVTVTLPKRANDTAKKLAQERGISKSNLITTMIMKKDEGSNG